MRSTFSESTHPGTRAVPEPFFRDEGGAEPAARGDPEGAARLAGDGDGRARGRQPLPGEYVEQLGLPVSGHARDRDHFAGSDLEEDAAKRHPERPRRRAG